MKTKIISRRAGISYLEISLLILSIFAFAFIVSFPDDTVVSAQETNTCCERTNYGAWCQNAKEHDCDPLFRQSPTSCDATSFCKSGCCYDSSEGLCMENTPQRVCQENEGTWSDSEDCDIPQCQLGCCVLGNQAAFVTLTRCKRLSALYGLETDFKQNIDNEASCIALTQLQDRGACVYELDYIRTCKFGTRQECQSSQTSSFNGTLTSNITFYKDYLCSAEELATNCGPTTKTTCVNGKDEVYFIDSCGNPANIYDASRVNDKTYWRDVISKVDSCGSGNSNGNADSSSCGNCDYFVGSRCGKSERSERADYGDYICKDLNCYNTYDGKDYRHGESWCVYDDKVGEGQDTVGSRHWKHICANGEEILEPCADFRQEICIQDTIDTEVGPFAAAACRANRWQDCVNQEAQDDCENLDIRECLWIDDQCVPNYPPGFNFYENDDVAVTCSQANAECTVKYEKGLFGERKCVSNCECLEPGWQEEKNQVCTALGDCGAKTNFIGKKGSKKGYKSVTEEIKQQAKESALKLSLVIIKGIVIISDIIFGDVGVNGQNLGLGFFESPTPPDLGLGFGAGKAPPTTTSAPTGPGTTTAAGPAALTTFTSNFIVNSLGWAGIAGGVVSLGAGLFGASENLQKALGWGVFSGTFATSMAYNLMTGKTLGGGVSYALGGNELGALATKGALAQPANALWASLGIGIAVGFIVFALMYKEESKERITFTCEPWSAPTGGDDCEECNRDEFKPCSEYRCKSLGQACQLLNTGLGNESCAWVNPHDVTSPIIGPFEDALSIGHSYSEVKIRPPGNGMRIIKNDISDGCIKAFTPLEFGITTNEPAQCKIDYNVTNSYDDMKLYFGGSTLYSYNHTQILSLPGPSAINSAYPKLKNDGTYTLYSRCQDANGNYNVDEFAIRFCVEKGPDTTPPIIMGTSIINEMPIQYGLNDTALDVYISEPAECRWSRMDKSYENMETDMVCQTNLIEINNNMWYKCSTTLTGIQNKKDNIYYFRCKDQPTMSDEDRNVNQESYEFILKGTQALNIVDSGPNKTISGSGTSVPVYLSVKTANGYNEGDSFCFYSLTGEENSWIKFFETGTNIHEQRQDLPEGNYTYYYKCVDLGGNTDYNSTTFSVFVDKQAPIVTRVYSESGVVSICGEKGCLKIVTDENSACSFSFIDCNFEIDDGSEMPYANSTEHYAEWQPEKTYYVRCRDESGNEPLPTSCSVLAKPYSTSD